MHTVWAKLAWLTPCEPGSAKQPTKQALTFFGDPVPATRPARTGRARCACCVHTYLVTHTAAGASAAAERGHVAWGVGARSGGGGVLVRVAGARRQQDSLTCVTGGLPAVPPPRAPRLETGIRACGCGCGVGRN